MIKFRPIARSAAAAAFAALFAVSQLHAAQPVPEPDVPDLVIRAAGDCYAIGQQVAQQNGGTLGRVRSENRGGQDVCVVVVVVPAKEGKRGRSFEVVVPN